MSAVSSTVVWGIAFVVVGLAAMFLMFHLWGYPFDKATRTSAAPRWAMFLHRALGYAFALLYVALMAHMVPRLWEYQVEFPARTVAHIVLGFGIGFLLVVKIAIIRWFRHFEEWMPYLGTAIMLGTVVLAGLSLPFALREQVLRLGAPGGDPFSAASRQRVATLLPLAGLPEDVRPEALATTETLRHGREVLLGNCVRCHDLRTVLQQPRTPSAWWGVVQRMADKPALFAPMTERDELAVTAYLVAITPDLQRAARDQRAQRRTRAAAGDAAASLAAPAAAPPAGADLARGKAAYEKTCAQCHELAEVEHAPPRSLADARALIGRMITENDARIPAEEAELIAAWLDATYGAGRAAPAPRAP